jgi:hypothetical protein
MRIRGQLICNATAPAANFTPGIYPLVANGGTAGVINLSSFVTPTVAASVITTPGATSLTPFASSTVTMPAAANYGPGVVVSATTAANSTVAIHFQAQYRYV